MEGLQSGKRQSGLVVYCLASAVGVSDARGSAMNFRLTFLLVAVATSLSTAAEFSACYCDKNLLPQPTKLVPGRKYARDRLIDIQHLKLDVTPDFKMRTIQATATLTLKPIARPLPKLELDAVDLSIEKVECKGATIADRDVSAEKLALTFAQPVAADAEVTVTITYSAQPERGLYFRTPEMGFKSGDTQMWSQGEAELHRFWFPSYDYPNERFTSEVICHAPGDMQVISNGKLLSKEKDAAGLMAWHWLQDKPHVNYLVALAAGYFHREEDKAGELPLAVFVPPSEAAQAKNALLDTKQIIEFYNQETGVPFAWDKYFQVYCLDFLAGGMENTSCTFLASGLLYSNETEQLKSLRWLDAHETAHQWFGDLVTCRDWSHLWLNEGFASYYTILYEEHKMGRDSMLYSLWEEAQQVFKANDDRPTVWRDYEDPMQQFDSRVYPRGAWILHMLRSQLGPDLYRKGIKTYLERHRNQVVGTDDLQDVMSEVSGLSLDAFFDQWLYHGAFPELRIDYSWDAAAKQVKLTVKQTQKVSDKVLLFRLPLPVRFTISGETKPLDFTVNLTKSVEDFYFSLPKQPDLVRIDPDYTVLAKTDFSPPPEMLKRQLQSDVIGRMLAVQNLGGKKDAETVKQLAVVLNGDAFHSVRSEAAQAMKRIATPEARVALIGGLKQDDARVRKEVVDALAAFQEPDAWSALAKQADTEKNPEIRAAIVRTWGTRPGDADMSARLRKELASKTYNNVVALAAIDALRAQDDASAVPAVLERLSAAPLDFRTRDFGSALDSLAFLAREQKDREAARMFIAGFLSSPREELRKAAAKSLGTLRDPKSIALLRPLTEVERPFNDPVREAAEKSIQNLEALLAGPQELKNVWDQMQSLKRKTEDLQKELETVKKKTAPQGGEFKATKPSK